MKAEIQADLTAELEGGAVQYANVPGSPAKHCRTFAFFSIDSDLAASFHQLNCDSPESSCKILLMLYNKCCFGDI
jgi:hypothetical protein